MKIAAWITTVIAVMIKITTAIQIMIVTVDVIVIGNLIQNYNKNFYENINLYTLFEYVVCDWFRSDRTRI